MDEQEVAGIIKSAQIGDVLHVHQNVANTWNKIGMVTEKGKHPGKDGHWVYICALNGEGIGYIQPHRHYVYLRFVYRVSDFWDKPVKTEPHTVKGEYATLRRLALI